MKHCTGRDNFKLISDALHSRKNNCVSNIVNNTELVELNLSLIQKSLEEEYDGNKTKELANKIVISFLCYGL